MKQKEQAKSKKPDTGNHGQPTVFGAFTNREQNNRRTRTQENKRKKVKDIRDTWINDLLQDYYQVDGAPLGERNPKWLQDDYVKFIRFAQHKIQQLERGVVAIITNHGFLDNPTFRGMRQSLMNTFDQLYFLDLHGNARKRNRARWRQRCQCFDIQQGVGISLLIKNPALKKVFFILIYLANNNTNTIFAKRNPLNP